MSLRADVPRVISGLRLQASGDVWQEPQERDHREEMAEEVLELVTSTSPDFVHSLSCIEEEGNESPGSGSGDGSISPRRRVETVPVDEPLDEKLLRLQSRVISMLEMQKRRQEEPQHQARRKQVTGRSGASGPSGPSGGHAKRHHSPDAPLPTIKEHPSNRSNQSNQSKASKSSREMKENEEEKTSHESDWRNTPGGAVQYRKNLAKHYKEQLEMLEHEEKELQHQMNLRQQLRLVLHDEAQQCERACLEPESELAAQNAHEKEATEQLVEENRQLDLLRQQLEEQLRVSEERRLQLERENQMLQQRPQGAQGPGSHLNGVAGERRTAGAGLGRSVNHKAAPAAPASLRTKSPRRVAYSPPRPRVTSPQRAWLSATKQAKQCAPPPPSPATEGRVAAPRSVPKFQHPRPARIPVQRVSPPRPIPDGGTQGSSVVQGRAKISAAAPGSTPEDGVPFPDGSHSARLPSPTREKNSGASSSPQPMEGQDIPPLPLPLSYREVKAEPRQVPVAMPAAQTMVPACETPSWAAVQHTYSAQAGPEEASRTSLECQKAGPPRRLGPGRGLVWPTLDLAWGEGPCSAMAIPPELLQQGLPASPWQNEPSQAGSRYVCTSGVQEKLSLAPDSAERVTNQRIARSLARSSSAANCGVSPYKDAERRTSPSPGRGSSTLIRSSSTPLVGQSRRPVYAVKPAATADAHGREDHFASQRQ